MNVMNTMGSKQQIVLTNVDVINERVDIADIYKLQMTKYSNL